MYNIVGKIKNKETGQTHYIVVMNNKKFVSLGNEIFLDYDYLNKKYFEEWEIIK